MSLTTDENSASTPPQLFASRRRRLLVGRRGLVVSVLSTVVVLLVIFAIFWLAPGGPVFRSFFFNPHDMWQAFVGDPQKGLLSVGRGLITNIWMFLLSEVLVLIFGLVIATLRLSQSPVLFPFRALATMYVDVMRGVPIVLVMYMIGFGLPELNLGVLSSQSPAVYGCATLTLSYSAYVAEVYRAGVLSVPRGQLLAARSLGLTHTATMRRVILPQAVRNVIPPLLNDFISMQKDTALVSLLGAVEATRAAQIYGDTVFNFSGFTVAAILFLLLTIPMTRFTDHLIARDRSRRLAST